MADDDTNLYEGLSGEPLIERLRGERETMKAMDHALKMMRGAEGYLRGRFDGATSNGEAMTPEEIRNLIHAVALMFLGEIETGLRPPSAADNAVVRWDDADIPREVILEVLNETRNMDRDALNRMLSDARAAQRKYDAAVDASGLRRPAA